MLQTDAGSNGVSPPKTPLWVKVFGIIVIVLSLLFVTLHLTGHSPMSHMSHTDHGVREP